MGILAGAGTGRDRANFPRYRDRPGSDFDRGRDRPGLSQFLKDSQSILIAVIFTVCRMHVSSYLVILFNFNLYSVFIFNFLKIQDTAFNCFKN